MSFQEKIDQQTDQFDLLIISCAKDEEATFWKNHLSKTYPAVITVTEEWGEGGAGNAFGTLQAIEKSSALNILKKGGKVALYHTAGKGTRMEPLTHAEGGMKAAIKLPAFLPDTQGPLSVLEMVIRQTAPLSVLCEGRLAVFWTDQLFLPSQFSWDQPTADVEVLSIGLPGLNKAMFAERKLSHYGMWGDNHYYDKLHLKHFETLSPFNASINLGSFLMTYSLLNELVKGYKHELEKRKGKLDTDPDWWTAATLPRDLFAQVRGEAKLEQYDRFKKLLGGATVKPRVLGPDTDWWDFGTVDSYKKQLLMLLSDEPEAGRLRKLFGIKDADFIEDSLIFNSKLEHCILKKSILLNVQAKGAHFDSTFAYNSSFSSGNYSQALIYGHPNTQ